MSKHGTDRVTVREAISDTTDGQPKQESTQSRKRKRSSSIPELEGKGLSEFLLAFIDLVGTQLISNIC